MEIGGKRHIQFALLREFSQPLVDNPKIFLKIFRAAGHEATRVVAIAIAIENDWTTSSPDTTQKGEDLLS